MIQLIIILLAVAAAAAFLGRRYYRAYKSQTSPSCGCGCGSSCQAGPPLVQIQGPDPEGRD